MNNHELAWCAGIVDGEGCISIHKRKPGAKSSPLQRSDYYRLDLKVKMIHKPTIDRLRNIFDIGVVVKENPGKLNKRVSWRWNVYGNDAIFVIKNILPFLFLKRDEALLAIDYMESPKSSRIGNGMVPKDSIAFREECYLKMRELKKFEWKE